MLCIPRVVSVNKDNLNNYYPAFSDCGFDVNKRYVHRVEETCVGPSSSAAAAGNQNRRSKPFIPRIVSNPQLPFKKTSVTTPGWLNFYIYISSIIT